MIENTKNTEFTPSADCPNKNSCIERGTCFFAMSLRHELGFERRNGKGSGALEGTLNSKEYYCSHSLSQAPQAEAIEFLTKDSSQPKNS